MNHEEFADDFKMYHAISSIEDTHHFQGQIDKFYAWCCLNGLTLNLKKCKLMTFHRKSSHIVHAYTIGDTVLERVTHMKDLGVVLDTKLTFVLHMDSMIAKANSLLGFVFRICQDLDNPYAIKSLYCAFVRSIAEYAGVVWQPYHAVHVRRIERIQEKFVWFALRKLNWNRENMPPYHDRCKLINVQPLTERRVVSSALFIFDIIENNIDCPFLLSHINFNAPPRHTRNYVLLRPSQHRTAYGQHEPINRMCTIFNEFDALFDFGISRSSFKRAIQSNVGH